MDEVLRPAVKRLTEMGPLPSCEKTLRDNLDATIERYEELLLAIKKPVTDAEAEALTWVFGEDDCFGFAWTLIGLIESAPGWPLYGSLPEKTENEWLSLLRQRASNNPKV